MQITENMITSIFPNAKSVGELVEAMNDMFPKYDINTEARVAGFLAQCGHESGGFRVMEENLNYSAKALDSVFGKYFKRGGRDADEYARQPEKIANVVYASRMGNGNTASGEGYKFRGRGYIQLTGKNNYTKFSKSVGMDIEDAIEYLSTVEGALESACWYWHTNKLNKFCDKGDVKGMTKRINGGYIGLEDRVHHWELALQMLGGEVPTHTPTKTKGNVNVTLSVGDKGDDVKAMQEALGIGADGIFGPGTKRALRAWQAANGLTADGVAGPMTLGKLYG